MLNEELASYARHELGQYFLVSPEKLDILFGAARIRVTDRVVELGAGAGTIARCVPPCRSLTLVELDERLMPLLRHNAPPHATVVHGDALRLVRELPCDVLIGSLPGEVTAGLLEILPSLDFRVAVLVVGAGTDLDPLGSTHRVTELAVLSGADYVPAQPSVSRLVRAESLRAVPPSGDQTHPGEAPD